MRIQSHAKSIEEIGRDAGDGGETSDKQTSKQEATRHQGLALIFLFWSPMSPLTSNARMRTIVVRAGTFLFVVRELAKGILSLFCLLSALLESCSLSLPQDRSSCFSSLP